MRKKLTGELISCGCQIVKFLFIFSVFMKILDLLFFLIYINKYCLFIFI